jgi:hypothetical protein
MRFRTNDDTSDTSNWSAWRTVWDQGNLVNLSQLTNDAGFVTAAAGDSRYVLKTGDTVTGTLNVGNTSGHRLNVNSLYLDWATSSLYTPNSVTGGQLNASAIGWGGASLMNGGAANYTGYITFMASNGNRQGYIGHASTTGANDTGTINYVAATHAFNGAIQATGDVTAYASDARLKTNVKPIQNAVEKVSSLVGYEYDWDAEACAAAGFVPRFPHEHGLLAQQVAKVMPDAVVPAPFNNEYLTVKYEKIVSLLVKAVTEQQEAIKHHSKINAALAANEAARVCDLGKVGRS